MTYKGEYNNEHGSDSSMDDKDGDEGDINAEEYEVQIPLWTIRTFHCMFVFEGLGTSSDSSMDDKDSNPIL